MSVSGSGAGRRWRESVALAQESRSIWRRASVHSSVCAIKTAPTGRANTAVRGRFRPRQCASGSPVQALLGIFRPTLPPALPTPAPAWSSRSSRPGRRGFRGRPSARRLGCGCPACVGMPPVGTVLGRGSLNSEDLAGTVGVDTCGVIARSRSSRPYAPSSSGRPPTRTHRDPSSGPVQIPGPERPTPWPSPRLGS